MEYYSAIKKNGILPFATTWMNIEGVMLSEIEKDKYWRISLICGTWWLSEKRGVGVG